MHPEAMGATTVPRGYMPPTEPDAASGRIKENAWFFSMVHPNPWEPGKGVFNREMLRSLAQRLNLHAIVPVPWTARNGGQKELVHPYPSSHPTFWYLPRVAPMALALELELSTSLLRKRLERELGPAPVLTYWADPDGTVAVKWARQQRTRSVLITGGSDLMILTKDNERRRRIGTTLGMADQILTVGPALAERVTELGIPQDRVSVLHRGVDHSRFFRGDRTTERRSLGLPIDRNILLWVGRMVHVKRIDLLLKALRMPRLARLDPLLILIGTGPLRDEIEREGQDLMTADALRMAGPVPHEKLGAWYRSANLTVLSSNSEGVPNALLESLACGTRFVATNVGSVAELTDDPVGDLVPPDDAIALADRIAERLTTPQKSTVEVPDLQSATATILQALYPS